MEVTKPVSNSMAQNIECHPKSNREFTKLQEEWNLNITQYMLILP